MTKPTKWHVRPAKTQISLGICPVWSVSLLSAWRKLGSWATHWAHSKDWSDWADAQADQSLHWPHRHFVGFVMRWLEYSVLDLIFCRILWIKMSGVRSDEMNLPILIQSQFNVFRLRVDIDCIAKRLVCADTGVTTTIYQIILVCWSWEEKFFSCLVMKNFMWSQDNYYIDVRKLVKWLNYSGKIIIMIIISIRWSEWILSFRKGLQLTNCQNLKVNEMFLCFRTDRSGQTPREEQSDQVYTVCHSVHIFWTHYSMVNPLCSNFRVITANFSGVRIFRVFTVFSAKVLSRC